MGYNTSILTLFSSKENELYKPTGVLITDLQIYIKSLLLLFICPLWCVIPTPATTSYTIYSLYYYYTSVILLLFIYSITLLLLLVIILIVIVKLGRESCCYYNRNGEWILTLYTIYHFIPLKHTYYNSNSQLRLVICLCVATAGCY